MARISGVSIYYAFYKGTKGDLNKPYLGVAILVTFLMTYFFKASIIFWARIFGKITPFLAAGLTAGLVPSMTYYAVSYVDIPKIRSDGMKSRLERMK